MAVVEAGVEAAHVSVGYRVGVDAAKKGERSAKHDVCRGMRRPGAAHMP